MKFTLLFGLCLINLIHGKYLLVDVDDTQNNSIEPNGNRCKYPPCIWWPKWHPQIESNEHLCIYPPCRPSAPRGCIPHGGKCSGKTMFSINIEFSARNSESGPQCCSGSTCVNGLCIQPKININGSGKVLKKDLSPATNHSNRMAPFSLEPQMVDLKKYLQDEIDNCNLPNRLIEVQAIKAQKHFWIRGKKDRGAGSDMYGFDYYISRNKDDNQKRDLIRTMRGYTGGVCRLQFEPERTRLQSHCEKLFEENLLAACFEFTPKFGDQTNSWDPTNPIEVPSMNPNVNKKWRDQKVAKIAKKVCQPLIRLHWPKNLPRDIPRERLMMDIALALRATGPGKEVSAPLWTPYYDLVIAELARGADDMMIMTIPEFAELFSHDVTTVKERVPSLNDMFTKLFKEPFWPDLFFCKCYPNCEELENKGDNFVRKYIRNLISEFETA